VIFVFGENMVFGCFYFLLMWCVGCPIRFLCCGLSDWDEPMNVPQERQPSDAMMGSKKELLPVGVPLLEVTLASLENLN